MRKFVFFIIFTLCFLMNVKITYSISTNGCIQVPFSSNIPIIDGQWSTSTEWMDTSETKLENEFNQTAYLRIKHNMTQIFVLIDFVTDHSSSTYDQGGICFDTSNNGGDLPQDDDYLFGILAGQSPKQVDMYKGTASGEKPADAWVRIFLPEVIGRASFSSLNDPYEGSRNHRIYEFCIPCKYLDVASNYGFYAFVCDWHNDTLLEWPKDSGGIWERGPVGAYTIPPSPQNWGDINGDFVPEFPTFLVPLLFMLATLLTTIVYRRRIRNCK